MAVKIICENIIEESHFLSATEQEGEFWGQPAPDSDNDGAFRLLLKGTPEDFSYSGTTTSDGEGDGTTVIDTVLKAFGDDYLIGGTVAITSGACDGESKSITDFARATGTITTAAFSAQIAEEVTFTLTIAFASRDFRIELITAGDAPAATFKWSHDGGATYFGRSDPNQADWLAETEINNDSSTSKKPTIVQAENGDLLAFYLNSGATQVMMCRSTDRGLTWGSPVEPYSDDYTLSCLLKLSSGRILIIDSSISGYMRYSDDNGYTWSNPIAPTTRFKDIVELADGRLYGVYVNFKTVEGRVSADDHVNWGDAITIADEPNGVPTVTITMAANGNLVCAYMTDEDAANDYEIKCKISNDNGATWGGSIDVLDFSSDLARPCIRKDINGDLYCAATHNQDIVYARSTDNGLTWGAVVTLKNTGNNLTYPWLLIGANEIFCSYLDATSGDVDIVRRGMWEAYSSNACPCAIATKEQKLICDAGLVWHGGAGIAEDKWDFEAEYYFSMKNIISGSPSKPWRSEQDDIFCSIVIDLGANVRHYADSVAFFGCNFREALFQMDTSASFGSPPVSENIDFISASGVIDTVNGNYIQDTSLLANYKDHELRGIYFRATSAGPDYNKVWRVQDNVGDYIILETTASHSLAATGTFVIYQTHISKTFTAGIYRYIRIYLASQKTAEGYYQIGEVITGRATELSLGYETDFKLVRNQNISILTTPKGAVIAIPSGEAKNDFQFTWRAAAETRLEILAIIDYLRGKNFVLIPDSTNLKDCSLLKITGPVNQEHRYIDHYDITVTAGEIK